MSHSLSVRKRTSSRFAVSVCTSLVLLSITAAVGQPTDTASLGSRPVAGLFRPEVLEEYQIPGERQASELLRPVAIALLEQQGITVSRPVAEIFLPGILDQYRIPATRPVRSMLRAEAITTTPRYEVPGNRSVTEILRPEVIQGEHYRIQDTVVSYDGYLHHYTLSSDFGTFEATGDIALRKLIREIDAIAALQEVRKSKVFAESLGRAAQRPFDLGKNLITNPVDTVTGAPKGVFTLFGNIGRGVRSTVAGTTDPSEDNRAKQVLQVSAYKREWAEKLEIDPYSSNTVLQEELNSIGWAGALGSLSLTAITLPAQATAVQVLKQMRLADQLTEVAAQRNAFGDQINQMVKELPPARMRLTNAQKLADIGISTTLANQYLDHPDYTPRHDAIIVESLVALQGTQGRDRFLQFALAAGDEIGANFVQHMAETLRGYHLTVALIIDIRIEPPLVVATAQNGSLIVPFPLDFGVWTERPDRAFDAILTQQPPVGTARPVELWVTGTVSPYAKLQLALRHVEVRENVGSQIPFID